MFCPNCGKPVGEGNSFCSSCGIDIRPFIPAPEPDTAKSPRKKAALIIILCLLGLAILAWGINNARVAALRQRVAEEDLARFVREIREPSREITDFLDPIMACIDSGVPADLDNIDARVTCNSIIRNTLSVHQYYRDLTERKGWDTNKYWDYEELYAAYLDLYEFFETICKDDPAFGELYSRTYLENNYFYIPFVYNSDDPASECSTYDALVKEYRSCLKRVT